jgi:hypothetical protein
MALAQRRRHRSRHGVAALLAMLLPGASFVAGLALLRGDPRFAWLGDVTSFPWELWAIAACGTAATAGGVFDWLYHRSGRTVVGRKEHRDHVLALGGGVPLFVLMAAATLAPEPAVWLIPVLAVLIGVVCLVCHDEFVFHRRCGRLETAAHRLLTFGNGLAFLAWVHWCFVRGGGHG